jgi:lysosomal Pro-X carboxypeptidase
MKTRSTLLLVVVLSVTFLGLIECQDHYPNGYYLPPVPEVYWYTQTFDHFNYSDDRTFQQRYLVYDDFYQSSNAANRPMFFCPGGEADVFGGYEHNGFMFQFGKKLGAFLLFPEHRFYGNSLPFGPVDSYTPENINKLTIQQVTITLLLE